MIDKMRLYLNIIICVTVFLFSGCTLYKYKKKIGSTVVNSMNLDIIKDGEYEGYYNVYLLSAKVLVKIKKNKIISIKLCEHKYDKFSGESMIEEVIKNQSLKVDAISGATNSCKTVLKAIENALKKGK